MKITVRLLTFSCILIFAFACNTDEVETENVKESLSTELDSRSRDCEGQVTIQTTIFIEWAPGTTEAQKDQIRAFYQDGTQVGLPYSASLPYLISWFTCYNNQDIEGWLVNHCCGCRPFHDPGDQPQIRASSFSGISTICGI